MQDQIQLMVFFRFVSPCVVLTGLELSIDIPDFASMVLVLKVTAAVVMDFNVLCVTT